jgi:hypothetical protein
MHTRWTILIVRDPLELPIHRRLQDPPATR